MYAFVSGLELVRERCTSPEDIVIEGCSRIVCSVDKESLVVLCAQDTQTQLKRLKQ